MIVAALTPTDVSSVAVCLLNMLIVSLLLAFLDKGILCRLFVRVGPDFLNSCVMHKVGILDRN